MSNPSNAGSPPNFTQVPNLICDEWMKILTPAEFKILICICRKTFGWARKKQDAISRSQIVEMTGLSRDGVRKAIAVLESHGLLIKRMSINKYGDNDPNVYSIKLENETDKDLEDGSDVDLPDEAKPWGGDSVAHRGATKKPTGGLLSSPTKERPTKERPTKDIKPAAPPLSEPAFGRITSFFFEKLKEMNPKIKPPNLLQWAKEMKLLVERDGRTEEEIKKIIEYIVEQHANPKSDFTWSQAVISPQKLRKHFATIWLEISKKKPTLDPKEDEKLAKKIVEEFKRLKRKDLITGNGYIEFDNGMTVEHCRIGEKNFREKCLQQLNNRKIRLEEI